MSKAGGIASISSSYSFQVKKDPRDKEELISSDNYLVSRLRCFSVFDLVYPIYMEKTSDGTANTSGGGAADAANVARTAKLLRLLRSVRILRVVRALKWVKKLGENWMNFAW